jgi:hypothetical protein
MLIFLLHLTWIPDSLFDLAKDPRPYYFGHPLIYILGFLCALAFMPKNNRDRRSDKRIMFTGLSNLQIWTLAPFFLPLVPTEFSGIEKLVVFVDSNMKRKEDLAEVWKKFNAMENPEEKDKALKRVQTNLKEYGITEAMLEDLNKYDALGNSKETLEHFLQIACTAVSKRPIVVELVPCSYSADINDLTAQIRKKVEKRILPRGKYENRELLFNLTPGTLSVSVALAFNATQGLRTSCYVEQNAGTFMTYNLDSPD